jgi:hypothetical protein
MINVRNLICFRLFLQNFGLKKALFNRNILEMLALSLINQIISLVFRDRF